MSQLPADADTPISADARPHKAVARRSARSIGAMRKGSGQSTVVSGKAAVPLALSIEALCRPTFPRSFLKHD